MESELHSAAIDTDVYEKEIAERAARENECSLRVETTNEVFKFNNESYGCLSFLFTINVNIYMQAYTKKYKYVIA